MRIFWVYITTNRSGGLYVGMTNDIERRIAEHKSGEFSSFASRYNMDRLVYSEEFSSVLEAKDRERQLKGWRRSKKVALIEAANPGWQDLFDEGG